MLRNAHYSAVAIATAAWLEWQGLVWHTVAVGSAEELYDVM